MDGRLSSGHGLGKGLCRRVIWVWASRQMVFGTFGPGIGPTFRTDQTKVGTN